MGWAKEMKDEAWVASVIICRGSHLVDWLKKHSWRKRIITLIPERKAKEHKKTEMQSSRKCSAGSVNGER